MKHITFIPILAMTLALLGLTSCKSTKTASSGKAEGVQTASLKTSAQCGSCKTRIEKALYAQKGVKSASVDLDSGLATVKFDANKTSVEDLRTAISQVGYDADDTPADPDAYQKLPACCKKGSNCKMR